MYYFVTFLFVTLAAKASFFDATNICWFLMEFILLWVGFHKKRFCKNDVRLFVKFAVIYIIFCSLRSLLFTHLGLHYWLNDVFFLFKYVLTSFLFCAVLREQAISYLIKVVYHLTIISLFFFALQLVSGDLVYSIGKAFDFPYAHFDGYVNFLVFTYVKMHPIQNSGFSWEPGAFGFFLNMVLLLHLSTNGFVLDRKAKLFALAAITTLSTTTFITLMLIVLLYARAKRVSFARLALFVVPLLLVLASSLPFLFDKIFEIYKHDMEDMQHIQSLSDWYLKHNQEMPLNRFASLLFISNLFGLDLIWGVSNIYDQTVPILKNINISNGIFAFLSQFGLIGLGWLCYTYFALFKKLMRRNELAVYALLILLVLGFSECIFVTSLVLCYLFLYHYAEPPIQEDEFDSAENIAQQENMMLNLRPAVEFISK